MFKYKNKIERDFWDDVFESVWGMYRDEENGKYYVPFSMGDSCD